MVTINTGEVVEFESLEREKITTREIVIAGILLAIYLMMIGITIGMATSSVPVSSPGFL